LSGFGDVDVLLHISTVEPLRPTSCEYIGV
jgi:hypothetical protein